MSYLDILRVMRAAFPAWAAAAISDGAIATLTKKLGIPEKDMIAALTHGVQQGWISHRVDTAGRNHWMWTPEGVAVA